MTLAPPPPVQNQVKTRWVLGRHPQIRYWRIAGVSVRHFDAVAQKKAFKNSPLVSKLAELLHRIILNKILEQLVLSMKVTSLCCNDCDQLRDVRWLHSPVNMEPLEAGGLGGPWWWCFTFYVVCCVLLCVQEAVALVLLGVCCWLIPLVWYYISYYVIAEKLLK